MDTKATPVAERTNPLHRLTGAALDAFARVEATPAWAMTPAEQRESLLELAKVQARLTELRWRITAQADRDGATDGDGSTSTAAWQAHRTRESRSTTNRILRGAVILDDPRFEATRAAFAAGDLHEEQVWVIIHALEDLEGDEVTDADRDLAQKHLITLAADHDATRLRILAKKLFEVIAPDEADRREADALDREERRARAKARFSLRDNGDGTSSGWFKLPTLQAQMLAKAVHAFAAPRRQDPSAWVDDHGRKTPYAQLLGLAFAELVEHLPTDKLPQSGGVAATLVVTMDLTALQNGLGSATLETGHTISPGQYRRLACNAGLIPAVLGSSPAPLDLGRKSRLHTEHQRIALALRDKGCTAVGCDRPPAWCEAHHDLEWSNGGKTDITTGRLLCPHHHHLAHDSRYRTRRLPDNKIAFHKRT